MQIISNQRYVCGVCGYIYYPEYGDEENLVQEGTQFSQLPEDWHCPWCMAPKENFRPLEASEDDTAN